MSVKIAWKQNILVTDSYLLKLLLVVFGFGLQAFVCDFRRQNICSVLSANFNEIWPLPPPNCGHPKWMVALHCFPCKDNSLCYLLNQQSEKYNDFRILTIKKQRLFFSSTYYTNTSVISRNQYLQSSIEILVFELKKCPKSICGWIGKKVMLLHFCFLYINLSKLQFTDIYWVYCTHAIITRSWLETALEY